MSKVSHIANKILEKNRTKTNSLEYSCTLLEEIARDVKNNRDVATTCQEEALTALDIERYTSKTILVDSDKETICILIEKLKKELLETYDDLVHFECNAHCLDIDSKNPLIGKIENFLNTKNDIIHILVKNKNVEVANYYFTQSSEKFTEIDWVNFLKEIENVHIGFHT